jgi:hypothetical protein
VFFIGLTSESHRQIYISKKTKEKKATLSCNKMELRGPGLRKATSPLGSSEIPRVGESLISFTCWCESWNEFHRRRG